MSLPRLPDLHCERHQAPAHLKWVQQGRKCVLRKRNNWPRFGSAGENVTGKFAIQPHIQPNIEPFTPPNIEPFTPPQPQPVIRCNRHQAPAGYYYRLVAGKCMLWKKHPNTPVRLSQAGIGFIYQNPSNPTATVTNTVTGFTNWVKTNKGLALALAAGAYYFYTKKK